MFYDFITKYNEMFCNAKASHNFSTKHIGVFKILTFEIFMKRKLMTLLVSNNRTQQAKNKC